MSAADFVTAIESNDVQTLEQLIAKQTTTDDLNAPLPTRDAPPALVLAARCGHATVVKRLLSAGAHIDSVDSSGRTAIRVAALSENVDVVTVLLAHRPNLALLDKHSQSALEFAIFHERERIVELLLQAGAPLDNANRDVLCEGAAKSTTLIQAMLDRGMAVNELRDEENNATPLHCAAGGQFKPAVLSMLLNVCACDLDARDFYGNTPAQMSAMHGWDAQLRWFIDAGADIDSVNDLGRTMLHNACNDISVSCVQLLLAAGADVHVRGTHGETACHLAAEPYKSFTQKSLQNVYLLLAAGASIDVANHSGRTVREILGPHLSAIDEELIEIARRRIAKQRLDFVRFRALQVCIGLQSRGLDALVMCEILQFACGPISPLIRFHQWWAIATAVKHSV